MNTDSAMENENQLQNEIWGKLTRLCSRMECCTPEIRKKISEMGGDSQLAEKIICQLKEEHFLDDERYITSYIREKFNINKWGRLKIHYYLKMKGLDESLIKMGWNVIDENEYLALLVATMKEKAKVIKNKEKYEKMGQIIRFTHSRGFEPELIHRHLNKIE